MVTLTDALKYSLNIPAVKLAQEVGLDVVRTVAEQFGVVSDLAQGPALALGASEASLLEMTGAYAGILNGGSSVTPYGMTELKLLGSDDPIFFRNLWRWRTRDSRRIRRPTDLDDAQSRRRRHRQAR